MAFVDLPNVTSGGGAYGTKRINFAGLARILTEGTRPVGVHAYAVDKGDRQDLFREIDRSGIRVIPVSPGKSIDGRLIFEMIVGAQKDDYDVCILASGDRDYVPVVQEVKRLKKQVWVASFAASIAPSLKAIADDYIDLDARSNDILLQLALFSAVCSDCGSACQVPFQPIEGRPVYCRNCLPKHRMKTM